MIIGHNMIAHNSINQLTRTNKKLNKSTEKLSTGFSINRAADNAAGLTISEKMRSQIRGLDQASRNIEDGSSYIQVGEGALSEVHALLHRINELSVYSANDTNTEIDRMAIDEEVQALKGEIDRIFKETEFNTKKIWEEDPDSRVQIGSEQLPAITTSSTSMTGTLNEVNKAAIPNDNRYKLLADENGIMITWDAYNGNTYTSALIDWPDDLEGRHSFNLSDYLDTNANPELTGLDFKFSYNVIEAATLENVIDSINGKTVYSSPSSSEGTTVYSDDGNSIPGISISSNINYEALLASGKDFDNYDDLFIEGSVNGGLVEDNLIVDPTTTSSSDKWVFEFEIPNIGTVKATSMSASYYSPWKDPDGKWWTTSSSGNDYTSTYNPTPSDGSLDSVINALDNDGGLSLLKDTNGVGGYIQLSFRIVSDSPYQLDDGSTHRSVGSMTMSIKVDGSDTVQSINDKLSKITGADIHAGNSNSNAPSKTTYNSRSYNSNGVIIDSPIYESQIDFNVQAGANSNQSVNISYKTLKTYNLGISHTNALTRETAGEGISQVAKALSIVSEQRSLFGAFQNRLEHGKLNADNTSENLQTTESKIRDVNMAKEMVEYSKQQILQQATNTLLSQANQMPQNVLALLK